MYDVDYIEKISSYNVIQASKIYEFEGVKQWRKHIIECVIGGCGRFNNHNINNKKLKEGVRTRNSEAKMNIIILHRYPCNYRHPCC